MSSKEDEVRLQKAMSLLLKASPNPKNFDRVMRAWKNSFKTGVTPRKDGGSVESYIKRNDGGIAKNTRVF